MKALGIPELTNVFNTLLEVGGRVVLGAIIIGAGLFIVAAGVGGAIAFGLGGRTWAGKKLDELFPTKRTPRK